MIDSHDSLSMKIRVDTYLSSITCVIEASSKYDNMCVFVNKPCYSYSKIYKEGLFINEP